MFILLKIVLFFLQKHIWKEKNLGIQNIIIIVVKYYHVNLYLQKLTIDKINNSGKYKFYLIFFQIG